MNNVVKNLKTSPKKSVTAKQLAKSNLTKRKNPDWDNLDRGYRYLTLDMKLPHDLAVAVMGNVVEESQGDYKATLKNGGGRGLIQWDGRKVPSGRYSLWGSIWASVAKPANVYDSTTDTVKNYWAPWGGLKGDKVRLKFIKAPLKEKARIYAESYLRPGKPRIADRQLSAMQLDSIYNPRIKDIIVLKNGGQIRKMLTAAGGPLNLSPEDIKRGANLVGEYFLKGLGAFGKIATAPFRSQGPTSATIYKSKELLAKERTIENKSEELLGKAMTWVSPLNYGAAVWNGHGLNARKGEEEVASWSPAWLALGRAAELYVGPKAVKGVKAAPKTIVNTAAKAGVKPAKAAVVAREIKLATKNKPKYTKVPSKNLFRTQVYKGGEITDPYSNFVTTDPLYAANYGKVTPYIFESRSVAKAKEPMMGYSDPVTMDMFIYNNTKRNPNATAIIGHDAVTGEFTPSKGTEILNMNPKNLYPIRTSDSPTSLAFFERNPSKNNIVGASLDYSMKDSKGMDFIKQFFALLKINGKEYTLEGLKDAKNVQQGLPEYIQSYLNLNTVERAVRAMRKNGYSEREILLYVDKVNEEMNKVKVGMYSDLEYNAAGALDFGGFYNSDTNFISINKDALLTKPAFTPNYIMKHEGRHLIDYNTSMTDDVINILEKAYDKDFLEIPKHEDAGSLKDYLHMDRERVTTNRDAREVFLSNLEKHPGEFLNLTKFAQTSYGKYKDMVDFLNELILYAEPEDIINAVENSNGYGKRYINYLKKNNKLTSTKIEQLRLAMIHVPSYLLPVAGGYTLYNLFNQPLQQLQYLKQGGKMNVLEFLKNGSGIHIKEKNKGKFTSYCGGKVTNECILKGKNSSNPAIRKRATFADNARHFKHRLGGILKALYGTPLNLSSEDVLGGLRYIAQGLGKVWDIMNAPIVNTQSTTAYLPNGSLIEIPGILGGAPEYLPGRFGRLASLKNRAWLEKSNPIVDEGSLLAAKDWVQMLKELRGRIGGRPVGSKNVPKKAPVVEQPPVQKVETSYAQSGTSRERFLENRKMGISKRGRVSSNDKNARAMEASDARITNAGNSNLKKAQLQQVERNLHKYPKHEIERFQNKTLLNMYRKGRSEKDIQKATREFYKYLADNYGYFKEGGILKAQLGTELTLFKDSENPNAVGGDIVNSYIRNQLMIPYLNKLKEDYEKWKLQMKQQANTLKSSLFDNLLNAGLSIGTDYLKSKLGV